MRVLATVEATKGTMQRYEKLSVKNNQPLTPVKLTNKKPKWKANYGYIEYTYQQDGDELDCFILGKPLEAGRTLEVTPVAMIIYDDEAKVDDKIICSTRRKISKRYLNYELQKLLRIIKRTKKTAKIIAVTTKPEEVEAKIYRSLSLYNAFFGE